MDRERVFDREMAELKDMILKMGVMVEGLIHKSVEALKKLNIGMAEDVIAEDEKVDRLELEIDEKCVELIALRQPEASDLRFIMTGSRLATDLERIGDLAEDIAERVIELADQPLLKRLIDIPKMAKLVHEALSLVLDSFVNRNTDKIKAIWQKEDEVDRLRDQVQEELIEIISKDATTVSRAIPLLLVSRHLERICDHVTNIAEDVVFMVEARVVKHGGGEKA